MVPALRHVAIAVAVAVAVVLAYDAARIIRALRISSASVAELRPFSARPTEPRARLLVLGDSTAVGAGAEQPEQSVAGRIGAAFPRAQIDNRAAVGARVADLADQLQGVAAGYDALLVQIGGNDILRFTGLGQLEQDFDAFLAEAGRIAQHTAVIAPGLIGAAPAIPWPLSAVYNFRSRQVRQRLATLAAFRDARFVDLESAYGGDDPFSDNPGRHYADDGLHPSGAGYGHWYATLLAQVPLAVWLERVDPPAAPLHQG